MHKQQLQSSGRPVPSDSVQNKQCKFKCPDSHLSPRTGLLAGVILVIVLSVMLQACSGGDSERLDVASMFRPVDMESVSSEPIQRLDLQIEEYINLDSAARVALMRDNYRPLLGFGQIVGIDTVCNTSVALWSTWPSTVAFMPQVKSIFKDLNTEEAALGRMLAVARYNGLDVPAKGFATVTWGNRRSIVFNDSIMYIALNHYLGPLNEAYNGWPEYERRLKTRQMLPVDMAEAMVATAYPYRPASGDASVLSRLLYEGALALAKQAMVPDASLASVLGFTDAQLSDVMANESFIWNKLVADNRLYSTDAELIHNLFTLRAHTDAISPDAPGRAVRYVGYRIVAAYVAAHPETRLIDLLAPAFYDGGAKVLGASGYSPAPVR